MIVHEGARVRASNASKIVWLDVMDNEQTVRFMSTVFADTHLSVEEARALAKQLSRLARRIEKRQAAASEGGTTK